MYVLAQVVLPVRLALLVFVTHAVKTLVVVEVCVARDTVKAAVWNA